MVQRLNLANGPVFLGRGGPRGLNWDRHYNSLHNAIASQPAGGQYVKTGTRKLHFGSGSGSLQLWRRHGG
jgi:hypothetical protein